MPTSVNEAFQELLDAINRENALLLAQQLWDIVHGLIPGFPAWPDWTGYSLQQIKDTCSVGIYAVNEWPYAG